MGFKNCKPLLFLFNFSLLFRVIRPLLRSHCGRWNFSHVEVKNAVCRRYITPFTHLLYSSVIWGYFTGKKCKGSSRNRRIDEELADTSHLSGNTFSKHLDASERKNDDVKLIGWSLPHNITLRSLDLSDCRMGNYGVRFVAMGLEQNTSIAELNLSGNAISIEGGIAIAVCLSINKTLAHLNLSFNRLDAVSAQYLGKALESNTGLTRMLLENNCLTSDGASHLAAALYVNTSLLELNIARNEIDGKGVRALSEAMNINTCLTRLNLNGNEIGMSGFLPLGKCLKNKIKGLNYLNLSQTGLDPEGMKVRE